ncbi:anhydro-N-acetylmuramic acid kinase [Coralloluteibacterium stylophorae]|uniref:Anhydro-N-acetylmuramic acid kinase n=1 Tax=Coralloluteibacterium stylophorae TaxID=1776034 RepID=A0A8J8AYQ9_9GAMM|nr:anhydro-N-acetylmuramic acid kinase [Coralloluteibacterium stylophorae]MBS7458996.1 anhydro-N-acetylmuramic acid kinase [Coralloluteibacterium stylophorae]
MQTASQQLYLGLISGTSADGIDAALVRFARDAPELVAAGTTPYPDALREEILAYSQEAARVDLDTLGQLDVAIGHAFAAAARAVLERAGVAPGAVAAIGSHGQTLRHRPHGERPFSMQVGDAAVVAERTGIDTVADFRRRDVAAGGQGAPLMPAFHAAALGSSADDRAVLNLGGIANLTLLPHTGPVRGFDTGPANGLMDAWCLRHRGTPFDAGGAWAAQGKLHNDLLEQMLDDPWLTMPPPKSTGRDRYHLGWLDAHLGRLRSAPAPVDVQATLCSFSAITVAAALLDAQAHTRTLLVCGGGVHNRTLVEALEAYLPGIDVASTASLGIDPDFVEAMGFAWLARETLAGRAGNRPEVTGAAGPRILGAIHRA